MDKNITGEGAKTSPVQTGSTRRSPRVPQGKQDKEVHSIPCRKGIKLMSEREANECAEHGEVLRWSTDSDEDEYPQVTVQTVEQATSDSEEPTEFGVVWERFVIRETEDNLGVPTTGGLEITSRNEDSVGIRGSNAGSPTAVSKITVEDESPILSEYESDGFLSRRKSISKRSQAKLGIFKRAKKQTPTKELNGSDGEDDDVPLVTLVNKASSNVVMGVAKAPVVAPPRGDACIGLHVARDFGSEHGVCMGTIVSVDLNRRRPLYHVLYNDGDEEDFDDQELCYAFELHEAHKNGLPLTTQKIVEQGTFPTMHF